MNPVPSALRRLARAAVLLALLAEVRLHAGEATGLRIASYNVGNYLSMPRRIDGRLRSEAGKPESEKQALVRMITLVAPDVLGLMELGGTRELEELRRKLREAGLEYPFVEFLEAGDPSRHLALLSRHPIVERHSVSDLRVHLDGITLHSPRGILDVTVEPSPGYQIRILALHLKAKLEVAEYDEGKLREAEGREVRRHVRDILRTDPSTRLVVMGDLNDTKNEQAVRLISGKPEWPDSLRPLPLADDRGEFWTEYWAAADVYSRIDYILVAKRLDREIDAAHSGIARPPFWNQASDHCPVYVSLLKPPPAPTAP